MRLNLFTRVPVVAGIIDRRILLNFRCDPVLSLTVERWESNFFQDPKQFPPGSLQFDNALLMRQVEHEWHSHEWQGRRLQT